MSDNLPEGYWYRLDKVYYAPNRSSLVVRAGGKSMYVMLGKRQERTIREYLATWFKEESADESNLPTARDGRLPPRGGKSEGLGARHCVRAA